MIYVFLFLAFITIITYLIINSIFKKTKKEGVPYIVGKKFIQEFNPKIGEELDFWHNTKNNTLNIYLKGTNSGQGKIGVINSIPDLKKFNNDKLFAKIHNITDDTIFIKYFDNINEIKY